MKYIPSLDALRTLAVFGVILYHFHYFPQGWIGVNVFFVLSGYLITAILLGNKKKLQGRAYFYHFYWRRILRIFPLYYGCLAVLFFAQKYISVGSFQTAFPWLFTYTFNFTKVFDQSSNDIFFIHFWSLAVEEQFYIFWPFVVYFALRQSLKKIVIFMIVAAPFLRGLVAYLAAVFVSANPETINASVYFCTTSHFDAFACGSALAIGVPFFCSHPLPKFIISGTILVAAIWIFNVNNMESFKAGLNIWFYCLVNFTSVFLISVLIQRPFLPVIFNNPALIYLGKISYGIYIWHLPCQEVVHKVMTQSYPIYAGILDYLLRTDFFFGNRISSSIATYIYMTYQKRYFEFFIYIVLIIAVSSLSYHFYEKQFRKLKDKYFAYRPIQKNETNTKQATQVVSESCDLSS